MKKIFMLVIMMACLCFTSNSYAEYSVTWESIREWQPLIYENGKAPVIVEVNGQKYFWNSLQSGNHVIKYNENNTQLYEFLKDKTDCIWTGTYYITRDSSYDKEGIRFKPHIKNPIKFYDADFNLVHEQIFGGVSAYGYPEAIAYDTGKYYCRIYDGETKTLSSTDMINWSEDNEYRWETVIGNTVYSSDPSEISVSGSEFYGRLLENIRGRLYNNMINLGEYKCIIDEKGIHFTVDGVYWLDIPVSDLPNSMGFSKYSSYAYEYGDNIGNL